jgi:hypothetical protein
LSRFAAFRTDGIRVARTIAGADSVTPTAGALLFSTDPAPDGYPAILVAMMNPQAVASQIPPSPGHASMRYKCRLGVFIVASSDGQMAGDAEDAAVKMVDATIDAFTNPLWIPQGVDATCWPCELADPMNVITDTGKVGIYIEVTSEIEWRT